MSVYVYCRVSTPRQNTKIHGNSLQIQEKICSDFAETSNLIISSKYKEVQSAYKKSSSILTRLSNSGNTIIIASVDRYSRNLNIGMDIANKIINNKGKLIFVKEKFICVKKSDLKRLKTLISKYQEESIIKGINIKNTKSYLRSDNLYSGGNVPYGQHVINGTLYKQVHEYNVIDFIQLCRSNNVNVSELNRTMIKISKLETYIPIECVCCDKNIQTMTGPMTYDNITELLNSYNITKRNTEWKPYKIKSIINQIKTGHCVNITEYVPKKNIEIIENKYPPTTPE